MFKKNYFDVIVVGSGAAGMIAAINSAKNVKNVLLLEKLPKLGAKLKATGGGRCNLTNTLSNEEFMRSFGREGRFMTQALNRFNHQDLIDFFDNIGVKTHAPDGFRVFPTTHNSTTILDALNDELKRLHVNILCNERVEKLLHVNNKIEGVKTKNSSFYAPKVIISTGGMGYSQLGADGDGYTLASELGHTITELSPAMMPLTTKEKWVKNCKADTMAKVQLRINLPKSKKLKATGDLIFTSKGIRGPVVLDFAREITPLLKKYKEVPLLANFTKGMNEEEIRVHLKKESSKNPHQNILKLLNTLLPINLSIQLCKLCEIDCEHHFNKLQGIKRDNLIKILAWTPLTVTGHDGFKTAMITRGGISLKEVDPNTMQSKLINGLYFCGEILNLDGPCGGYNLQWSFSSGYMASLN